MNVDLMVLDQGIDTTTIYVRLQFNILEAIGEFERELIRERSLHGRMKALQRGVRFGARPKLTAQEIKGGRLKTSKRLDAARARLSSTTASVGHQSTDSTT